MPTAHLAPALAALFPMRVTAAEITAPMVADAAALRALLSEEEWRIVSHCHPNRMRDFTAGRLCAHRALTELGADCARIAQGADREPCWPGGVVGSITHTEGYCAAAAAYASDTVSLGIDTECATRVKPALWPRICGTAELERFGQWPPAWRAAAAALVFVAKEAFFKCQFPLTREWLGFEAVTVLFENPTAESGEFTVEPRRPLRLDGRAWQGRFRRHETFVTAAIAQTRG